MPLSALLPILAASLVFASVTLLLPWGALRLAARRRRAMIRPEALWLAWAVLSWVGLSVWGWHASGRAVVLYEGLEAGLGFPASMLVGWRPGWWVLMAAIPLWIPACVRSAHGPLVARAFVVAAHLGALAVGFGLHDPRILRCGLL